MNQCRFVTATLVFLLAFLATISFALADEPSASETVTLTGTILGRDGPVAGVKLVAAPTRRPAGTKSDDQYFSSTTSDDKGRFELQVQGNAPFAIGSIATGYGSAFLTVENEEGEDLEMHLATELALEGRVFALASGDPLVDADVQLLHPDGIRLAEAGAEEFRFKATTGADGVYRIDGLSEGEYRIKASGPDLATATLKNTLIRDDPSTLTFDIPMAPGTRLAGKVVDHEGRPIAGARVNLTGMNWKKKYKRMPKQMRFPNYAATSNEDGTFVLEGRILVDSYNVEARHKEHPVGWVENIEPGNGDLLITIPQPGALTLILLGDDGEPVRGDLKANIRPAEGALKHRIFKHYDPEDLVQDEHGRYTIAPVGNGPLILELYLPGSVPIHREVEVEAGATVDLGAIDLPKGATLRGVVTNDLGQAIAGASIAFYSHAGRSSGVQASAESDENGKFAIRGFDEGSSGLLFARATSHGKASLPVTNLDNELTVVLFRQTSLAGTIIREDLGEPATTFTIRVLPQSDEKRDGRYSLGRAMQKKETSTLFSERTTGQFVLGKLTPGKYTVTVEAPGCMPSRREGVVLVATERLDLGEIYVAPGTTVEGRVVSQETGLPVAGVEIRKAAAGFDIGTSSSREEQSDATTDPEGLFSLRGLPPGRLRVAAEHEDFSASEAELDIVAGATPPFLTIALGMGGAIEGIAKDKSGVAIPHAKVIAASGVSRKQRKAVDSDENGHFRIEKLRPGSWLLFWIDTQARGAASSDSQRQMPEVRQILVEEGKTHGVDLPAPPSKTLHVRGRISGGTSDTSVRYRLGWSRVGEWATPVRSMSGSGGSFEVTLPAPGDYRVNLAPMENLPDGEPPKSSTLQLSVTAQNASNLEIVIPDCTISGAVRSGASGLPIDAAKVGAIQLDEEGRFLNSLTVTTDETGTYQFDSLQPGHYKVLVSAKEHTAQMGGLFELAQGDSIEDIDMLVEPGTAFSVKIRQEQGDPVSGMLVVPTPTGHPIPGWDLAAALSEEDGTAWLYDLPAGIWDLVVIGPGAAVTIVEGVPVGPEITGPVNIVLGRAGGLSITAIGDDAKPIARAKLSIHQKGGRDLTPVLGSGFISPKTSLGLRSAPSGLITIESLEPGAYKIEVTAPDGRRAESTIKIQAGEVTSKDMTLR